MTVVSTSSDTDALTVSLVADLAVGQVDAVLADG